MILSSDPKPVKFRIVLNNVEITSLKSLKEFFDFERFLVTDQMQIIRWLKRDYEKKSCKLETILKDSGEDIINDTTIPSIMRIVYDADFIDMTQFVDFLYGQNKDYEKAKSNFIQFISNHGDKLHQLFPIESVSLKNSNLKNFFSSLTASQEISSYRAQLHYRHGDIEKSRNEYPPLWILQEKERKAIRGISSGQKAFPTGDLSIIGVEFIFLCAMIYLTIHQKDDIINYLSIQIDQSPKFKLLRDCIGGSIKALMNNKKNDCYELCRQLGYTTPHKMDPLFNEKLFLSSFFADDTKRIELLSMIKQKYAYFPALFVLHSDRYESSNLQSQQEVPYTWFNNILDYHDKPMGLDGDEDLQNQDMNEMAFVAHQFKLHHSIMSENFCEPNKLDSGLGEPSRRELIQRMQSLIGKINLKNPFISFFTKKSEDSEDLGGLKKFATWFYDPAPLCKKDKVYLDFFDEVVYICNHMIEYINTGTGAFTPKAETLIKEYRKKNDTLKKERLFVVAILLLIRDHNKNSIFKNEKRLNELKKNYIPLKALFKSEIRLLGANNKKILNVKQCEELLTDDWKCECYSMTPLNYRRKYYDRILRRWISNLVYFI